MFFYRLCTNKWFYIHNTDFRTWKRGRQCRRRYMKICTFCMRRIKENPFAKFCCTGRTWKGKLWRSYGNLQHFVQNHGYFRYLWHKSVYNFYSWISYNFFRVHFERLSVYQVFCMFFWFVYFFLHLSSVESGWKSRRMKVFYFVNEFLVCMFDSSHSTCFFNCFFNF